MPKLLNFTLDGKAIRLTGYLNDEDKPVYEAELLHEYDGKALTIDELLRFAKALSADAEEWGGLLHRFPEERFSNDIITEFDKTWGGEVDVQAQGRDAGGGDAE